jgi:hypothetical protein
MCRYCEMCISEIKFSEHYEIYNINLIANCSLKTLCDMVKNYKENAYKCTRKSNAWTYKVCHYVINCTFLFDLLNNVVNNIDFEICALLGCYATLIGNHLPTFRDKVSVPFHGSRNPRRVANSSWTS